MNTPARPAPPRLHAVTNSEILELPDFTGRAASLAHSRGIALHVRTRRLPGRRMASLAGQLIDMADGDGAQVFVNDRVDVALLAGAHGVHLPADGLSVPQARDILGPAPWIGRSVHGADEAQRTTDEGADYVFLGPIWDTPTHPGRPGIGVEAITRALPARVVAIGGIDPGRVQQCRDAGAYGVAAISALWRAPDPGSVADEMLLLLGDA